MDATKTPAAYQICKATAILHFQKDCRDQCHHQGFEYLGGDFYQVFISYLADEENEWIMENDG